MNKHKSNKIKENSNTVRHLIMGQITSTQNLVAIKEVRHAGQQPKTPATCMSGCVWHWPPTMNSRRPMPHTPTHSHRRSLGLLYSCGYDNPPGLSFSCSCMNRCTCWSFAMGINQPSEVSHRKGSVMRSFDPFFVFALWLNKLQNKRCNKYSLKWNCLHFDTFIIGSTESCRNASFQLQWRHNERDGASNHQRLNCLLNLFGRRSKKTTKLRVTGLCVGNPPLTGELLRGIPRWPVNSHHKGQVMQKMFPFDDVIMQCSQWLKFYQYGDIFVLVLDL